MKFSCGEGSLYNVEMRISLKSGKIYFTRAGFYLLLFSLGLASSSFFTGTNILFLLDFFLFSVLLFNYVYLIFLSYYEVDLVLPIMLREDQEFKPLLKPEKKMPPCAGEITFAIERFGSELETRHSFLRFSDEFHMKSDFFTLRGQYEVQKVQFSIQFPFPLFDLKLELPVHRTILVVPNPCPGTMHFGFDHAELETSGDLSHIRQYQVGDPIKYISWKHYARHSELMVRHMEVCVAQEESYVLEFTEKNEKKVFSIALGMLQEKLRREEPFVLMSRSGVYQYKGGPANELGLMKFLASYQSPHGVEGNQKILGGNDA